MRGRGLLSPVGFIEAGLEAWKEEGKASVSVHFYSQSLRGKMGTMAIS